MAGRIVEKHQLAGLDERERGFNRLVEVEEAAEGCRAVLRYEAVRVETGPASGAPAAIEALARLLHEKGYRQLRSRPSFRGDLYLGSQEPWVEYADPREGGFWRRLLARLGR